MIQNRNPGIRCAYYSPSAYRYSLGPPLRRFHRYTKAYPVLDLDHTHLHVSSILVPQHYNRHSSQISSISLLDESNVAIELPQVSQIPQTASSYDRTWKTSSDAISFLATQKKEISARNTPRPMSPGRNPGTHTHRDDRLRKRKDQGISYIKKWVPQKVCFL